MKNETGWIDRPMGCLLRSPQLSNVFVVLGDMLVCERRVIRRFGHRRGRRKKGRRGGLLSMQRVDDKKEND